MGDETLNSNIEWKKKKGFGATEKTSRRIDKEKAMEEDEKSKSPIKITNSSKPLPSQLPQGLKKLRKKIKEVYDEDEDEDFYTILSNDSSSSLVNALYDEELKQLGIRTNTINNQKMNQNVEKVEAVRLANQISKELGFKGIDKTVVNKHMQDSSLNFRGFEKILQDDVMSKAKISSRQLSKGETVNLLRGIKRIKQVAIQGKDAQIKTFEGLNIDDIIKVGRRDTDDNKVAEIILKKSGRKDKKEVAKTIKAKKINLSKKNQETIKKIEKDRD